MDHCDCLFCKSVAPVRFAAHQQHTGTLVLCWQVIDGWRDCWPGGWDRCRICFVVMVERRYGYQVAFSTGWQMPVGLLLRRRMKRVSACSNCEKRWTERLS